MWELVQHHAERDEYIVLLTLSREVFAEFMIS